VFCDLLWYSRNQALHKAVIPKVTKLAANIKRVSYEHFKAWSSKLQPVKEVWSKPPQGFYKINFDAAIREDFSTQATVCRNSNGEIIQILTQVRPSCSPIYGEALAAQLASHLAASLQLDHFIIEGDSAIVILSIQNPALRIDWHIEHVICETLSNFQVSSNSEARKVNKSANFCAHYAAYRAADTVIPGCILSSFSPLVPFVSAVGRMLLSCSLPCEGFCLACVVSLLLSACFAFYWQQACIASGSDCFQLFY
jgi:hypothetical protein